jgi:hypothetical protein
MTLLTVFVGIIALSNLIFLISLAFLASALKRAVDKGLLPAMSEVTNVVRGINKLLGEAEGKAERIMDIGEDTARKVSGTVVATTEMVQQTVASPIIGISSLMTGISKAVQTWRSASARPTTGGNR